MYLSPKNIISTKISAANYPSHNSVKPNNENNTTTQHVSRAQSLFATPCHKMYAYSTAQGPTK